MRIYGVPQRSSSACERCFKFSGIVCAGFAEVGSNPRLRDLSVIVLHNDLVLP